jgi:hypothetical protein
MFISDLFTNHSSIVHTRLYQFQAVSRVIVEQQVAMGRGHVRTSLPILYNRSIQATAAFKPTTKSNLVNHLRTHSKHSVQVIKGMNTVFNFTNYFRYRHNNLIHLQILQYYLAT